MRKPDKFKVGDTAWKFDQSRSYKGTWTEYRVSERTKTGYVMQRPGVWYLDRPHTLDKVSTAAANRAYYTTEAKADYEYAAENRYKISAIIERNVDSATLRKIADLIGYKPAREPHA